MWLTLTERQSRKSRSPKAVFVFGSLRAACRSARCAGFRTKSKYALYACFSYNVP